MIKRTLLLLLVLSGITMMATAQTPVAPPGAGTSASPYLISTWQHLYWMTASDAQVASPNRASRWSSYYRQTANIDFSTATPDITTWSSNTGWDPIGTDAMRFTGEYNGDGFTISGLQINRGGASGTDYQGLFGYIGATGEVKNLKLTGVNVSARYYSGGLAGSNYGTVTRVDVSGTVVAYDVAGGITGVNWGTLYRVSSDATVSNTMININASAGGLTGILSLNGIIEQSFATGTVTSRGFAGGLAGDAYRTSQIIDSYARGQVTGSLGAASNNKHRQGGIAGNLRDGAQDGTSGASVLRSYATGEVIGDNTNDAPFWVGGGIAGSMGPFSPFATVTNSFADTETTTKNVNNLGTASRGGLARTTAQMKTESNYTAAGWNFTTVWMIFAGFNDGYPALQWQELPGLFGVQPANFQDVDAGTSANPYQIAGWRNLYWLSQTSSVWGAHFIQTENIDLGLTFPDSKTWDNDKGWTPIGNTTTPFSGVYNGNNKSISRLFIDRGTEDHVGLFGVINGASASVTQLSLDRAEVTGQAHAGILAGSVSQAASLQNITIDETSTLTGTQNVGALAGSLADVTLIGEITVDVSVTGQTATGGIAGSITGSVLEKSVVKGSVTGGQQTGGVAGNVQSSTLRTSIVNATIEASQNATGSFAGRLGSGSIVQNSYSRGNVTVTASGSFAGGFAGQLSGNVTLTNNYSTGSITASGSDIGGFVGGTDMPGTITVSSSYWNTTTSGRMNSVFGTGLTTAQMQIQSNFTGWDFNDIWGIAAHYNDGFPHLQTEDVPAPPFITAPSNAGTANAGTASNPYTIASWQNLNWIAASDADVPNPNRAARWAAHYIQTADIDLTSATPAVDTWDSNQGFIPIGTVSLNFTGVYNGDFHSIRGLYIHRPTSTNDQRVGLFGMLGANALVTSLNVYGTITGNLGATGGITANTSPTSTITLVNFAGTVHSALSTGNALTGGLVGYHTGTISKSSFNGRVSAVMAYAGGLAGYIDGGNISDSYATGTVSASQYGGGIAGGSGNAGVQRVYASVRVGPNSGSQNSTFGPVIGTNSGTFTNVFYLNSTFIAGMNNNRGSALTDAQMRDSASFTNFVFTTVWQIGGSNGITTYPYLRENNPSNLPQLAGGQLLAGSAGWRLLSSPALTTFADVLSGVWTQGGTGANTTSGTSNVFTTLSSTNAAIQPNYITDFTQNVTLGHGFAVYVYNADADGSRSGFPKFITTSATANASDVTVNMSYAGQDGSTRYAIAGNPFNQPMNIDQATRSATTANKYWVFDSQTNQYRSRANGVGSFNGLVQPYQGFWVEHTSNTSVNATITMPAASRVSGGQFYGKEMSTPRLVLKLDDGTYENTAWVSFFEDASEGYDTYDAVQFSSLSGVGAELFTIVDDKALDINFLPFELAGPIEIALGANSSSSAEAILSVSEMVLPEGFHAELVDLATGELIALNHETLVPIQPARRRAAVNTQNSPGTTADVVSTQYVLRITPGGATSVDGPASSLPSEVSLAQNWPNPFNPATQIAFALPASGQVRLDVYDLLGRRVAVLVDAVMPAGTHAVNFDASRLSSGVYLYRLQAGSVTITRRMTLVK
jgi:hypothetical protein